MKQPESSLNPLTGNSVDSRAHARRNTKTLNPLNSLNPLSDVNPKEFKEFKDTSGLKAPELLANLESAGFVFTIDGDSIKWRGPAGVLTAGDREAIKEHKAALVALVKLRDYEQWTRTNKVDWRHAAYLKKLHAWAEYQCGQRLGLDATPLPHCHPFDASAAYRSQVGREERLQIVCAAVPMAPDIAARSGVATQIIEQRTESNVSALTEAMRRGMAGHHDKDGYRIEDLAAIAEGQPKPQR